MREGVLRGAIVLLLGLPACSSAVATIKGVSVSTSSAVFSAEVVGDVVTLSIPIDVTNTSESTVLYQSCGSLLERTVGGSWRQIWAQTCSLSDELGAFPVPGGSRVRVVINVRAVQQPGNLNFPSGDVTGQYRIALLLTSEAHEPLPLAARTSNEFAVAQSH